MVPEKVKDMQKILSETFSEKVPNLDMDVMGCNSKKEKIIVVQLRSRDDTGGTTAKGSLVDMLRGVLRMNKRSTKEILYLVAVWDERNLQQKNSTIVKMYSSLKGLIDASEDKFFNDVTKGVKIKDGITLKLAYGVDEIMQTILNWAERKNDKKFLNAINDISKFVEKWDDLWVAYSLASLEIEIRAFKGLSNIKLVNEKFEKINSKFDFSSYSSLVNSINEITDKIIPLWTENSIPLQTPADQIHYIRDLLFLKACYNKSHSKKNFTKAKQVNRQTK